MTALVLPLVRYFTKDSPYHYTTDNQPLQDLAARDDALNTAFQAFSSTNQQIISAGNWGTIQVNLDVTQDQGKPFAYKLRTWAIQDQSIANAQNASFFEDIVFGYSGIGGAVTISNTIAISGNRSGATVLTRSINASSNTVILTFSGYTGTNGFVLCKAERFGI